MTPITHRARWIMIEPGHWIENGCVVVRENRILDVGGFGTMATADGRIIDHGDGILMPALVNAHTHISLSSSAKSHASRGFVEWVERLIADRNRQSPHEAARTVQDGTGALKNSGTGLVGDFGPHVPVAAPFESAGLQATVWMECLGNDRSLPPLPVSGKGIRHAYGGHAPHTTSPALLKRVQAADAHLGQRFCLHLAESREETEFLSDGKGPWADFMTRMGIDFSNWGCFGERPVEAALNLGLLDRNTLAVHLLEINSREMEQFSQTGAGVCLCPRSNWMLHRKLPDIQRFLKAGVQPAIGTDSLASVSTLSLLDEMRFIYGRFPGLSPDVILGFGTMNGARVLGCSDMGSLRPGNRSAMIRVALKAVNAKQAAEAVIATEDLRVYPIF